MHHPMQYVEFDVHLCNVPPPLPASASNVQECNIASSTAAQPLPTADTIHQSPSAMQTGDDVDSAAVTGPQWPHLEQLLARLFRTDQLSFTKECPGSRQVDADDRKMKGSRRDSYVRWMKEGRRRQAVVRQMEVGRCEQMAGRRKQAERESYMACVGTGEDR
eukprot:365584-Chlamydomonas_euryale.AAC.22